MENTAGQAAFPFGDGILGGHHALVCGASKGIGRAAAKALAQCGADVTVCARSAELLDELCMELVGLGAGSADALVLDLEDIGAVEAAVTGLVASGPIHILVNNAAGPPGGPLLGTALEDFEPAFKRHLHAAHTITRLVTPGMELAGMGRIVNVISTSVREPIDNIGLSNTLRGAMASWSKSLSRELPGCITINNILPGFTDTDRLASLATSISESTGSSVQDIQENWISGVPIGRLVDPRETGIAIAFLCLPTSGAIRGVSLAVDGGRMRSI